MSAPTVRIPVSALVPARASSFNPWMQDEATTAVADLLVHTTGLARDMFIDLLTSQLHALPLDAPKAQKSGLIRLIAHLDAQREEAELTADPARRAGIERAGEHFAHKAQSGFSPHPLPPLPSTAKAK